MSWLYYLQNKGIKLKSSDNGSGLDLWWFYYIKKNSLTFPPLQYLLLIKYKQIPLSLSINSVDMNCFESTDMKCQLWITALTPVKLSVDNKIMPNHPKDLVSALIEILIL